MSNKIILRSLIKPIIFIFSVLILASACKKEPKTPTTTTTTTVTPPVIVAPPTRAELTKDSIFLYARDTYFWNEGMPSYEIFKPRSYSSDQAVLDAIIKLPGTNKPVDKYSFLDNGGVSTSLGGVSGDFGFSVFYNDDDGNSSTPTEDLRIKYVSPGSPAATAGLIRGYQITTLNGRTGSALSTSSSANVSFVSSAVFGSATTVSMTVKKPDGNSLVLTIARATYANNPIYATKIFTLGSKKVGYLVYHSFTTNSRDGLRAAIGKFHTDGASELIVDLRYNGGGSVATSDVFTNLLAPASVNGQVMYTTYWTKTMQDGLAKILANQPLLDANGKLQTFTSGVNGKWATYADINYKPTVAAGNIENFAKEGAAEFKKIYFLVLSGTASASELVINNLKAVMPNDVKLIGRQTYGKPVGFFAISIDNLDLYVPQFETRNQKNYGGFYEGLVVDKSLADDVTKDFGDEKEALLAAALAYSEKGFFSVSSKGNTLSSISGMPLSEEKVLNQILEKNKFNGMIDDRPRKLIKQ
ncbi:S41 family peptidase [Daejeonella sp.]|jgi:carboxyl-terminal processing protease|uniref:S41 family peptidase n=1 Tax=Daejeonella sp. TaxID=2805397 RepID=UPI0027B87D77|nr:S41 family peptidase [Daejeonella sp.]